MVLEAHSSFFFDRIQQNLRLTPLLGSWLLVVCFLQNISVRAVLEKIHLGTMVLPVRFILISQVLFDIMLVRCFLAHHHICLLFLKLVNLIDILAHRQLSAAIGYSPLHATLHSKSHVERVLDVVNRRHRMAQMAGRASVEFYVGLALKSRGERERKAAGASQEVYVTEEAFVIRTFRNGLGVFVSKSVSFFFPHP